MDLFEKETNKISFIVSKYSDEQNDFESQTKVITNKLKKIIDELANSHSLISSNSVRKIKHYSFVSRVKEAESLKEKLVRNNLCNNFFPILIDDFQVEDGLIINQIKQALFNIDDLIGIKILTDLNIDCKKMYELVSSPEFKAKAIAQNITLSEQDLKQQPQPMKNGLDIYKIKGVYSNYRFELQIKSKIISAWGDMEHSIFYKDYYVSPVRDSTQSSMNHVGKLLFDIDDFLVSIRNANKLYEQNAQVLSFLQWFEDNYSSKISEKIGNVGYRIDGISDVLYQVYQIINVNNTFLNRVLRSDHFELETGNPLINAYIHKRNRVYDLKILESIVLSWQLENEQIVDINNLETVLTHYINLLQNSAANYLAKNNYGYDTNELLELIQELYNTGFSCNCNESFLLSINSLYHFFMIRAYINDVCDGIIDENYISAIIKTVFIFLNKGEIEKIVEILYSEKEIDREKLKKAFIQLRDNINIKATKYKIDLKNVCEAIIEIIN